MQQLKITVTFLYDAPAVPAGIFDDFSAIQPVSGNLSTMSFSDFVQSRATTRNPTRRGTRLVVRYPVRSNKEADTVCYLSSSHTLSVTEFSPKVFDALVNQTVVGSILRAYFTSILNLMSVHSSGGSSSLL